MELRSPGSLSVTRQQLARFRLRANNLAERLPRGQLAAAAFAGLQDTAPRAALMALHARVEEVQPDDWAHPSLVQTWAPRGAVYVVPAADLWVFALGIGEHTGNARLEPAAQGRPIRWDTHTTEVLPPVPLRADPGEASRELARRYLRSLGPGDAERFRLYAAVTPEDARRTFEELKSELAEVSVDGRTGWLLREDVARLAGAQPVTGARLVPSLGDPILQRAESELFGVYTRAGHLEVLGVELPPWCLSGVLLVEGEVVGSYGRRGGAFALVPLRPLSKAKRTALEAEAWSAPIQGGVKKVEWRSLA